MNNKTAAVDSKWILRQYFDMALFIHVQMSIHAMQGRDD
jgi:hypothetical protein